MMNKVRSVIADEKFGDYVLAALPIVCIILGAIVFTVVALVRGQ